MIHQPRAGYLAVRAQADQNSIGSPEAGRSPIELTTRNHSALAGEHVGHRRVASRCRKPIGTETKSPGLSSARNGSLLCAEASTIADGRIPTRRQRIRGARRHLSPGPAPRESVLAGREKMLSICINGGIARRAIVEAFRQDTRGRLAPTLRARANRRRRLTICSPSRRTSPGAKPAVMRMQAEAWRGHA